MITDNLQELISGKGFIMVNKGLAKAVGLVASTIYGELVSTFLYWKDRQQLTEHDGKQWFFCTIEDLEDKTTIKKDAQGKAIKALEKEGLIETKRIGLPSKRHFHITDKYIQILLDNYIAEKPQSDNTNGSEAQNTEESRPNQIAGKPKTALRENRKQYFGKTDTNKKELIKKNLIKEEEEEASLDQSSLITFLKEKGIDEKSANLFITTLKEKGLTGYTDEMCLKAIDMSLVDFINGICNEPYIWAVGKLERILDGRISVAKESAIKTKQTSKRKPGGKQGVLPEWANEITYEDESNEPKQEVTAEELEERRRKLRERFSSKRED